LRIKKIRSNNGTEFKNSQIAGCLEEEGIKHEFSSPYTPQQNGVVERKNRTLLDMATNGSQVKQVDLDELDNEEALCITLRNMSIGDVCPKESEEPTQARDQPSSSMQVSPPTQDEDQTQIDEDQENEPPQEEDIDQGGDDNEDKEDEQEIRYQRPPHPRVHQAIQRDHPVNSILGDIHNTTGNWLKNVGEKPSNLM
jgi:transposase InsO family protein